VKKKVAAYEYQTSQSENTSQIMQFMMQEDLALQEEKKMKNNLVMLGIGGAVVIVGLLIIMK
jgi:hypothetical protein